MLTFWFKWGIRGSGELQISLMVLLLMECSSYRMSAGLEIMNLLEDIKDAAAEAGGRVVTLFGNHEFMDLMGKVWRDLERSR